MKKILSLIAVALCSFTAAMAQVSITFHDQEVAEGDILTIYATETVDDFTGEAKVETKDDDPLFLATTAGKFTVTLDVPGNAINNLNWCGINGQCQNVTKSSETRTSLNKVKMETLMLHAHFTPKKYDSYMVAVTTKFNMKPVKSFYINFVYDAEHATAIEGVTANQAKVRLTGNVLNCQFQTAATRTVQVYGVDGKLVKSATLNQAQGNVSLAGLQQGVYVYNVLEAGKSIKSDKVVLN